MKLTPAGQITATGDMTLSAIVIVVVTAVAAIGNAGIHVIAIIPALQALCKSMSSKICMTLCRHIGKVSRAMRAYTSTRYDIISFFYN
jgi:uncharacterized Tic20 family protein